MRWAERAIGTVVQTEYRGQLPLRSRQLALRAGDAQGE